MSVIDSRFRQLELGSDSYITRPGDTLDTIAYRYRMTVEDLASLNPGIGRYPGVGTPVILRAQKAIRSTAPGNSNGQYKQPAVTSTNTISDVAVVQPQPQPVVQQPVVRQQRIVPRQTIVEPVPVPQAPTVLAPAVSAVVSDMALLNPSQLPAGQAPTDQTMRQGVIEPITYAQHEVVEEEYVHQSTPVVTRQSMDDELNAYVGSWRWPTNGQVARGFAPQSEGRHGIDIAGVPGQPVMAVLDGTVAYSGKDPSGAGNLIIVRHKDNLLTAYSHTRDLYVAEDDTVRAGDPIATLGANSRQESVLRFEVRQDGNSLNPMNYLSPK